MLYEHQMCNITSVPTTGGRSEERDVHDPYGENEEAYKKVFDEIEMEIDRIFPEIVSASIS